MPIEIWCKGKSKDTEKQNILYIQEAGTSKCRSKMTQMIKVVIKFVENHEWSSVCSINIFSERKYNLWGVKQTEEQSQAKLASHRWVALLQKPITKSRRAAVQTLSQSQQHVTLKVTDIQPLTLRLAFITNRAQHWEEIVERRIRVQVRGCVCLALTSERLFIVRPCAWPCLCASSALTRPADNRYTRGQACLECRICGAGCCVKPVWVWSGGRQVESQRG